MPVAGSRRMDAGTRSRHRRMGENAAQRAEDSARMKAERSRTAQGLLLAGVVCIVGGEALCIVGPLKYEHIVHAVCHTILYAGIGCSCLGVVLHLRSASRAGQ